MIKNCTSIEQSRKLLELGIDANTADMFYADILVNDEHKYIIHPLESYGFKTFKDTKGRKSAKLKFIPAWSLSALESLMPYHIIENNNRYAFYQVKGFNRQGHTYKFKYMANSNLCLYETSYYNNAIDAAFEMVCWLKKEEYI